jgi:hypothetical protein
LTFNTKTEVTDRPDPNKYKRRKDEFPLEFVNVGIDNEGPGFLLILFKTQTELDDWYKRMQQIISTLKVARSVVYGSSITEMMKKCVPPLAIENYLTTTFSELPPELQIDTDVLVPPFMTLLCTTLEENLKDFRFGS